MAAEAEVADVSLIDTHVLGILAGDRLLNYFLIRFFVEGLIGGVFAHLESWPLAEVGVWWRDSVNSSYFHPSLIWVQVLIVWLLI